MEQFQLSTADLSLRLSLRNEKETRVLNIQINDFSQQSRGMPSRAEAEAAFRTIIRWAGENPDRPGLIETPSRAARAFREYFAGYEQDPLAILDKTFDETGGYEEMVTLRGISFESHCEHHLAPIVPRFPPLEVCVHRPLACAAPLSRHPQTSYYRKWRGPQRRPSISSDTNLASKVAG